MEERSGFQVGVDAPFHYEEQVAIFMAPFVAALVAAGVKMGDDVLDVACGTGFATRAASNATGPSGSVIGSDLNPSMLAMARSVEEDTPTTIDWHEASALDLPFSDHRFGSVSCQQGIQFFPDVAAGLREMARVLQPGGVLSASVWAPIEQSPFFATEAEMLIDRCGSDPDVSLSAFPVGGELVVRNWFESAGLRSVTIELVEAVVSLPPVSEYVPRHLKALPWSAGYFELSEHDQQIALADLTSRLSEFESGDGIDVPFRSYLATATV